MPDASLELRLPSPDDGTVKAEIVEWLVAVGDLVRPGQTVCTVETDKTVVDLACPFAGMVASLGAAEGEVLEVGAVLMTAIPDPDDTPGADAQAGADGADGSPLGDGSAPADGADVSPMVRRLAEEFGVDLAGLRGTGPYGRITRADVQQAAFGTVIGDPPQPTLFRGDDAPAPELRPEENDEPEATADPGPEAASTTSASSPAATAEDEAAAQPATTAAVPVLTLYREVEVGQLLAAHRDLDAATGGLPLDALLVRLALPALAEHPRFNGRVSGQGELEPSDSFDVAVSCAGVGGLSFPVVRQAGDRSLRALGRAVTDLATRARRGLLRPAETGGQTFTVHDLGPLGVTAGTTGLPTGTVALASYGRPRPTVRMIDGAPREVPVMTLALTADHRVIDDGEAARFLAELARYLEAPILAFTD